MRGEKSPVKHLRYPKGQFHGVGRKKWANIFYDKLILCIVNLFKNIKFLYKILSTLYFIKRYKNQNEKIF